MLFDITRLIEDCGGASALAKKLGVARTTPYRWAQQGMVSSRMLVRIKEIEPNVNIDDYIVQGDTHELGHNSERRAGVPG